MYFFYFIYTLIFVGFCYSVVGKSSVVLDIKPWDDETDMKKLEEAVKTVQMEGLLWGACKIFNLLGTKTKRGIYDKPFFRNQIMLCVTSLRHIFTAVTFSRIRIDVIL